MYHIARIFAVFTFVLILSLGASAGVRVGDRPFYNLKTVRKQSVRNITYREKIVVVIFWASHNPQCVVIGDHVQAMRKAYDKKHIAFLSINFDDSVVKAKETAKRLKFDWPMVCDGLGWLSPLRGQWGVQELPYCVMIGPKGKVIWTGSMFKAADELRVMTTKHLFRIPPKNAPHSPATQQAVNEFKLAADLIRNHGQYSKSFDKFTSIPRIRFSNTAVLESAKVWMELLTGPHADKAVIQTIMKKREDVVNHLRELYTAAARVETRHKQASILYEQALSYERRSDPHSGYFMHMRALLHAPSSPINSDCSESIREYHDLVRFRIRYLQQNQLVLRLLTQAEKYEAQGQLKKAIHLYRQLKIKESKRAWGMLASGRLEMIEKEEAKAMHAIKKP